MLNNIKILLEACQELNINYEILHRHQNLVRIKLNQKIYYFVNYSTPFNSKPITEILKDKEYTYELLKDIIRTPKTIGFLSPFCAENYQKYLEYQTIAAIESKIGKEFELPVIIKRNRGTTGKNVFLCEKQEKIADYITRIFDIKNKDYDYVALAQEYLKINREYRAIFFEQKLLVLYEKDKSNAQYTGNLSPLHWEGAKARYITDTNIISSIETFVQPIFQELPVNYAGFDIAIDHNGTYWLIEINSAPNYDIFTRDNDKKIIVKMFKKMLEGLTRASPLKAEGSPNPKGYRFA